MTLKPLNLDDLLGESKPIVVVYSGKRYALRKPEGLSPVEYTRWARLQAKIAALHLEGLDAENLAEESATELEQVIGEAIRLLSPELAEAGLPFGAQMMVLQHYVSNVHPDKMDAAGKGENQGNPIGA